MLHSVWAKSLRDQRRALLSWGLALVLLVGMYAAFYPSMHRNNAYGDLVDQMPDALRNLFTAGTGVDLTSGAGYVYMEMLSFMAPTLLLLYAIGAATQAIAGEEDRRTLDLLLATPLTRARLVLQKCLALAAGIVALAAAMGVALVAFGAAAGMGLANSNVVAAMVHLALLTAVFAGLALLVGAATGNLALARGVAAGAAVASYLVNGFAPSVSWLHPLQKGSPFYQFLGHDPIRHGFSLASLGVAAATVAVLVAASVWTFRRRDVGA